MNTFTAILDILYYLLTNVAQMEVVQGMLWICIMMIVIKFVKGVVWL